MFRTVSLSITRSLVLYTQQWYMSYRLCWPLASGIMIHPDPARKVSTNLYDLYLLLCVQYQTPGDGQRYCPKHVEFYPKNKFEKLVHLFGFIISVILCWLNRVSETIQVTDSRQYFPRGSHVARCWSALTYSKNAYTPNKKRSGFNRNPILFYFS